MKTYQWKLKSSIGPMYLVISEKGLRGIFWKKQDVPYAKKIEEHPFLVLAIKEISEYLEGKRKIFSVPLDIVGTPFQKSVWKELLKIPYGKTCTYRDIAKKIKNEKAVRAVGTANGRNPLSLIIPCHRVIATSGELAGYAGGIRIKAKLLKMEKELL